jgi:hypothetical protein
LVRKLPNAESAVIDDRKITEYLLSDTHPLGRAKARYLRRFGFSRSDICLLRDALLEHATAADVMSDTVTPYGRRYILRGAIQSPDGRNPVLVAIWDIDTGHTRPRFVSAYPGRRR